jgi:hypothetical protein
MWGKKWRARSVDAVGCQDCLVSVLALRNVSMKHWWVETDGENPKYWESSLAVRHVFCHRTHTGWTRIDPGPRDDETLLDLFDIIHIRALSVFLLFMYFPFSIRPLICSVLRISVVFLVLKVLAYFSMLLTNL